MSSELPHFWPPSPSPSPSPVSSAIKTASASANIPTCSPQSSSFLRQTPAGAQIRNLTLLQLQREIKEEEDEIFADLDSLLNSRTFDELEEEDKGFISQLHKIAGVTEAPEALPLKETVNQSPKSRDITITTEIDESMLENEQYEHLQAMIKQVTNILPKPCVFFLEGNCRRSDCKFSHDLSSIPCKYWMEGFCFKGEMCPFSHDFTHVPHLIDPNDPNSGFLLDEEGRPLSPFSAAKREQQLNPTFVIDSEADFPSLPQDAIGLGSNDTSKSDIVDQDSISNTIRDQILCSNAAVVFRSAKRKRRKG